MDHPGNSIVVFEGKFPGGLLEILNDNYLRMQHSEDVTPTRPVIGPVTIVDQNSDLGEIVEKKDKDRSAYLLALIFVIVLSGVLYWKTSRTEYSPSAIQSDHLTSEPAIEPLEPTYNLAVSSEGAHILPEYTSPPHFPFWWYWGKSIVPKPEGIISPSPRSCWPLAADSAVGIGLREPSKVTRIRVNYEQPRTSNINKRNGAAEFIEQVLVYQFDNGGNIERVYDSRNATDIVFEPSLLSTNLIIRTRLREAIGISLSKPILCIRNVEIIGVPIREK